MSKAEVLVLARKYIQGLEEEKKGLERENRGLVEDLRRLREVWLGGIEGGVRSED